MPFSDVTGLKQAIVDWMFDRPDLATVAGDFVDLCHADLNKVLRTRQQLNITELSLDDGGESPLPNDYLAWRNVTALTNPRVVLEFVAPTFQDWAFPFDAAGIPRVFTIYSDKMVVRPLAQTNIRLEYWASIPKLESGTNQLLLDHPDVYLYGSLHHACLYIGNQERAAIFASKYAAIVDEIISADRASMYSRAAARPSRRGP